ncbi:MAG: PQQ-binding-like beta-propeller repeat protein [Planctomycetes bacterium]|nr:PQQ-binding-like beta-propeller repeat protein [Planctomycetota bacterium]
MKSPDNNTSGDVQAVSAWHRSAVATALVGAVFSVIVLALIVGNYIRGRVHETRWEKKLENLRIEISNQPDDEQALLEEIRRLDLEFRRAMFRVLDFSRTGSYLLLASLSVFVIGIKWAGTFKEKMPAPQPQQGAASEQIRQAMLARWSVAAALGLAGAVMLFLAIGPRIDFRATDAAADSYPTPEKISRNWHRFRGPEGAGISADVNMPESWDGKSGKGILWKTKVPVAGHNSPVVWGDRLFLSGGDPNRLNVFCFDALSGELLWTGDVKRAPLKPNEEPVEVMEDTGWAAPTVTTDGKRVFAIFVTGDLACFDFSGRSFWSKNLGTPDNVYGYASSLEMYRNLLLIQYDQGDTESEKSKLIALDGFSGRVVWQAKRPVANSWSTPIVARTDSGPQIITAADPWVIAYEPNSGAEIWRAECLAGDVAPTPIYANGLTFVIEPYSKTVAIRTDGKGDVTKTHIAWSLDEPAPDICSPIGNGEFVFILNSDGLALCFKAADGEKLWEEDIGEGRDSFLASPSLVGDKLYLLTEKGIMIIAEVLPKYNELARCELGEECCASPAFVDGRIYIRGVENLYCIGKEETTQEP